MCGIEVVLILLNLDCKVGDIIVNLSVPSDLVHQTPVISVSHSSLEDLEFAAQASEQMVEPCGQGVNG
jgi:hypothetical protein